VINLFPKPPFTREIEPKDLYLSQQHREALARLQFVVSRRGLGVLTGEVGAGKSTAVRALQANLDDTSYDFVYVHDSELRPKSFYNAVLKGLAIDPAHFLVKAKAQFREAVMDNFQSHNRQVVIVIDDAQFLTQQMLDELRFVMNFRIDSMSPLTLILVGQASLWGMLKRKVNEALFQRITVHYNLEPLNLQQAKEYIQHHIKVAGGTQALFPEDVITRIHQYTKGLPREINNVCFACLIDAQSSGRELVDNEILDRVLADRDVRVPVA